MKRQIKPRYDLTGREVKVGDLVAYGWNYDLKIGKVVFLLPTKFEIQPDNQPFLTGLENVKGPRTFLILTDDVFDQLVMKKLRS